MITKSCIYNLGRRVWKAAQKEMKRTANAEKNLQKSRSCINLQADFLLQAEFLHFNIQCVKIL